MPLTRTTLFLDVFARWKLPLILCARTKLGTINHTLLSLEALRSRVHENTGGSPDPGSIGALDRAARETELSVDFGAKALRPEAAGVRGAVGRILAVAFLAELDGSWSRFKECSSPTCRAVFWDRSKNRSGRWCTMKDCGNRAKVRAYRERERTTA